MSRIGKKPIAIPEKVEIKINGGLIQVKGPKGSLEGNFHPEVKIEKKDKSILVSIPETRTNTQKSLWGLSRTLLNNMIVGVTEGFVKKLEFNGVGYRAAVQGNMLTLNMGHSHQIDFELPAGITAKVNKNVIEIIGCSKELVGFVSAKVRSFRPPEPYKGKGIKYAEEVILRKAGKTGVKK